MLKHRTLSLVSVLGIAGSTLVGTTTLLVSAGPALAAPAPTTCLTAPNTLFFDTTSPRDRHDDVAIGTPLENVGKLADAGTVTIAAGDENGTLGLSGGTSISMDDLGFGAKAGDHFGAAVLEADLNGDGCGDLVVGAPGRSSGAGVVIVIYGQPQGQFTSLVQVLKQGLNGVGGAPEAGDGFGSSLAVTGDGTTGNPKQLWVGVPGEDLGSVKDAGMAVVFPISDVQPAKILSHVGITSRQQGTNGLSSTPQAGDRFAATLAGSPTTMLIGVPGQDVGSSKDAGMFHAVVKGKASSYTAQTAGVPGTAEPGDALGTTLAIMGSCQPGAEAWVVGEPFEDIGTAANAGNVILMDRGTKTAVTVQQGSGALAAQQAEAGDHFGAALNATGTTNRAKSFLAIGDPLEDVGSTRDAGLVTTLTTDCSGGPLTLASVTDWTQDGAVPGNVTTDNRFGAALGAALVLEGDVPTGTLHYRLLIDVPGADEDSPNGTLFNSGMVMTLPAAADGFTVTGSSYFGQDTGKDTDPTDDDMPGVGELGDAFGMGLSANAGR